MKPEIRYCNCKHVCVPPRSADAFYAIETVRVSTFYRGEEYISRHDRTGWLKSDPKTRTKFKDRKAMDRWIDAQVTKD